MQEPPRAGLQALSRSRGLAPMDDEVQIDVVPHPRRGLRVRVRGNPDRELILKIVPRGWTITDWSFDHPERATDGIWYDAMRVGTEQAQEVALQFDEVGRVRYSPAIKELIDAARTLHRDFDSWDEAEAQRAVIRVVGALENVDEEAKRLAT
jgi:hypothetical protein